MSRLFRGRSVIVWPGDAHVKLYRHYKNKAYKYLGVARHSESLEEVVLYETLYKNDLGKLWVRPKKMFEESIDLEGVTQARFAKIPLEIRFTERIQNADLPALVALCIASFDEWDQKSFDERIKEHREICLIRAFIDGQLVGFKLGYKQSPETFYSWLGAVQKDFRKLGIATDMMNEQHRWAREKGYKKVQTKCLTGEKAMLIFNLKNDFKCVELENNTQLGLKLILEKNLL